MSLACQVQADSGAVKQQQDLDFIACEMYTVTIAG